MSKTLYSLSLAGLQGYLSSASFGDSKREKALVSNEVLWLILTDLFGPKRYRDVANELGEIKDALQMLVDQSQLQEYGDACVSVFHLQLCTYINGYLQAQLPGIDLRKIRMVNLTDGLTLKFYLQD